MPITTLSSRQFNQELGRAKKISKHGPVFITDRGRPTHVLLDIDEYRKITGKEKTIIELLTMPEGTPDFEFDPPRLELHPRAVDFD